MLWSSACRSPRKGGFLTAHLRAKLVKGATLKISKGAPHGLCTTHKARVNEDLLAFLRA